MVKRNKFQGRVIFGINFRIKERLIVWISGSKRRSISTQEINRKMILP